MNQIFVKSSLTNTKVPITNEQDLTFYICGPTIYNSSHLGHARTYITFDIIRRLFQDYFGKNVIWQMNITDIDDKIITKSNEQGVACSVITQKYEAEFFNDLQQLNVLAPTYITRVTDFMPEIITFITKIIDNGFAYCSNGSVYFDTQAFTAAGFQYPKLRYITEQSQQDLLAAGEGISMKNRVEEKHNPTDFALWKAVKANEPSWESPFGAGRPGWHIECSVMANSVLLQNHNSFHIHLGGKDLQFPHHANEIAQLEAYYGKYDLETRFNGDIIKYFLHTGHLRIDNEVMSKSKMNFKTIQDVLSNYSNNQIRILFLLVDWMGDINYSIPQLDQAVTIEQKIKSFYQNIEVEKKKLSIVPPTLTKQDYSTLLKYEEIKQKIDAAYRDNLDYTTGFKLVLELVDLSKSVIESSLYVAVQLSDYVFKQISILGLIYQTQTTDGNDEQIAQLVLDFRQSIKQVLSEQDQTVMKQKIMKLCDNVRDEKLIKFGYLIEDGKNCLKKINLEEYLKDKQREELLRQDKAVKAEIMRQEKQRKADEEKAEAQVKAEDMFKTAEFSAWDEKGIPTKMADGSEVSKSGSKKYIKMFDSRKKLNEKYDVV